MPTVDVFLFPGSTYTWLTVMRAPALAAQEGVALRWRPFDVRAIMREMDNRFLAGKPQKYRHMWRDLERRAARFGIPWHGAPAHPVDPELKALKAALVAAEEGWIEPFLRASFAAWFAGHRPPGTGDSTEMVVAALGRDPALVMARAESPAIAATLAGETEAARRLGIFGSPSFVVGDELFWGDDRLEEALAWAKAPHLASPMPPL